MPDGSVKDVAIFGRVFEEKILLPAETKKFTEHRLSGGIHLIKDILNTPPSIPNVHVFGAPMDGWLLSEGMKANKNEGNNPCYYINKRTGFISHSVEKKEQEPIQIGAGFFPAGDLGIIINDNTPGIEKNSLPVIEKFLHSNVDSIQFVVLYMPVLDPEGGIHEILHNLNLLSKTILILEADKLRDEGLHISRKFSWDRTIADSGNLLIFDRYNKLKQYGHLVIRFGLEGALWLHHKDFSIKNICFICWPDKCEGDINENSPGMVYQLPEFFCGFLVREVLQANVAELFLETNNPLKNAIRAALIQTALAPDRGMSMRADGTLQFPFKQIIESGPVGASEGTKILSFSQFPVAGLEAIRRKWSICESVIPSRFHLNRVMKRFVLTGKKESLLQLIPTAVFDKLTVIDKNEIENLRSMKNLIREYCSDLRNNKPLPIAVFGPPGAGKTFSVKCVAISASEMNNTGIAPFTFNLSQFASPDDLYKAFHVIRDSGIQGKTPLVFFDEFDTPCNSQPLGWLKYFLAPMFDGEFREGESVHPIGRAVFVFAGGVYRSLKSFSHENCKEMGNIKEFKQAKGPDFVSRLKGYVDITGPNPFDREWDADTAPFRDPLYITRRAVLLRTILCQNAENLFDNKGYLHIDNDVLDAFLFIPAFKHGARSIEALIKMSSLKERKKFDKAALPTPVQMSLHVDSEVFCNILDRHGVFSYMDHIAQAIHKFYCERNKKSDNPKSEGYVSIAEWGQLDETFKNSNRNQASHYPAKLLQINCGYRKKSGVGNSFKFNKDELEFLARDEFDRWKFEREKREGSVNEENMSEISILADNREWDRLSEDDRNKDLDFIKHIPCLLGEAGFEIYRLTDDSVNIEKST